MDTVFTLLEDEIDEPSRKKLAVEFEWKLAGGEKRWCMVRLDMLGLALEMPPLGTWLFSIRDPGGLNSFVFRACSCRGLVLTPLGT